MAKRKVSPLVQAMALFAQMDERDRQTLSDYVRTVTATPRKRPATRAPAAQKDLIPDKQEKEPLCNLCGHAEDFQDHSQPSPNYHKFEEVKSKKTAAGK